MIIPAAVALAAALTLAPAHHTPPPPVAATIRIPAGLCLTATTSGRLPVALTQCNPADPAQQWVLTPRDRFRLAGTSQYLTAGPAGGMTLGPRAGAPVWVLASHQLAAAGLRLTWCESATTRQPWLQAAAQPDCQVWDVLTRPGG